jgi:aldose 1-epimerase
MPLIEAKRGVESKHFGNTADHQPVEEYTLTNAGGASVSLITYGATVTRLLVPDKAGGLGDIVLGCDELWQYEEQVAYFGATIGRVGNRIAGGQFSVDQMRCTVPVNSGLNHLHGGFKGYDKQIWDADGAMTADGPSVRLTLIDPDGAEGYPGTVNVTVIYTLTASNTLKIQYYATTSKPTPVNLTNHSYFNLKDGGRSGIDGHVMKAYANAYTPTDEALIPTGEIVPVKGAPIDFTTPKPMGRDIAAVGIGYDHNLVLNNSDGALVKAAEVYEPETGRAMEVWTTESAVQFYTGNFLDGSIKSKGNLRPQKHSAFCLEAQHYPDAVHHPKFPDTILRPGETYRQITEYRFSTRNPFE